MKEVVVRSADSGAWLGKLESRDGTEVVLKDAIRLWYWDGAASLSQLAAEGVNKPDNCKFGVPLKSAAILGVCEVLDATEDASVCVRGVEPWRA